MAWQRVRSATRLGLSRRPSLTSLDEILSLVQAWGMSKINVRVLHHTDWEAYRAVRLSALQESPEVFLATHADEAAQPEQYWRDCLTRADRLLAERDGAPLGVATVERTAGAAESADLRDLWVTPEARTTGVASRLVQAAVDQAVLGGCAKLYYWVSTENGRAIAFASNAGFLVTSERRTTPKGSEEFGDQEVAMVLPLGNDPSTVPNSMLSRLTFKPGPR